MGAQCSADALHRQSAGQDEDFEHVYHAKRPSQAGDADAGLGGLGGLGGRVVSLMNGGLCSASGRPPSMDGEAFAPLEIDSWAKEPEGDPDGGRSAMPQLYYEMPRLYYENEPFEEVGFREAEPPLRWAPACPDAEVDMDQRHWAAMMSAVDMYITPLERVAAAPSSTATPPSSPRSLAASSSTPATGLGEETVREAAFAQLRAGRPLYTLPEHLRADKEIVLAAIGTERQYCYDYIASKELRERDRDVVKALVGVDGSILERCCEELRADRQLVRMALRTCSEALSWAPKSLQADKELKAIAASRAKEEKSLLKRFEAKVCGPVGHARCGPG